MKLFQCDMRTAEEVAESAQRYVQTEDTRRYA
jgi:hypothetical protein